MIVLKDGYANISPLEWKVLANIPSSLRIVDIAKKTGLPYSSTRTIVMRLRSRARISFIPSFKELGLIPIMALYDGFMDNSLFPTYTVRVINLYGNGAYTMVNALVPYMYRRHYLELIDEDPLAIVEGHEFYPWHPDNNIILYNRKTKNISYTFSKIKDVFNKMLEKNEDSSSKDPTIRGRISELDVAIISEKIHYAFAKVSDIAKKLKVNVSKQLLSYHFRSKVSKIWRYNSVVIFRYPKTYPYKIFLIEGEEASHFAKSIYRLPGFDGVIIDRRRDLAVIVGQPDNAIINKMYEFAYKEELKVKINTLTALHDGVAHFKLSLYRHFEKNSWKSPRMENLRRETSIVKSVLLPLP